MLVQMPPSFQRNLPTSSSTSTSPSSSIRNSKRSNMDDESIDREERKREYNRLAQREFRRRRKEHLKSLEQAQKERTSEQSGEIERLRHQNAELRRENEALRAQLYGMPSNGQLMQMPNAVPSSHITHHQYPDSPSNASSVDSISGTGSPPASMGSETMPMAALSLASSALAPQYNDAMLMSFYPSQRYSMVTSSSVRRNARSSPESSDFGSPRSTLGPSHSVQYVSMSRPPVSQPPTGNTRSSYGAMAASDRMRNGEPPRYAA